MSAGTAETPVADTQVTDTDYQQVQYAYVPPKELSGGSLVAHPVVVVGAGPVGLAAAIDLAQQGVPVVLLDDDSRLSTGSRAICFSKRSLEIFDALGCGDRMMSKGVSWQRGRVYLKDEQVYSFDLLPETGHKRPAFINLQQYYVEGYLVERARRLPLVDLRWCSKVVGVAQDAEGVTLDVETPDGRYRLRCAWVIACDGARSPIRGLIGQESRGRIFRDRFLIADIRMQADFPTERRFWFDPPFHPNQSVLMHKQPDGVWRIDWQLGWDADPQAETREDRVLPRIRAVLGEAVPFELVWVSVYTFACKRMERFRHGRILFAGDSAHGVSPFGARGANSGLQDVDNLCWKLQRVLAGTSPASLLDSYDSERVFAADENIRNSTRSTDFITPKSPISRVFRDAVLTLAREAPFARVLVNSGRLSVPAILSESELNTADTESFAARVMPGAVALDAPVRVAGEAQWLIDRLPRALVLLIDGRDARPAAVAQALDALREIDPRALALVVMPPDRSSRSAVSDRARADAPRFDAIDCTVVEDTEGLVAARYDLQPGTCYLLRPDQHVAMRSRTLDAARLKAAALNAVGIAS